MESASPLEPHIEALNEFYSWIDTLPVNEAETAIRGLREYAEVISHEQPIEVGRLRYES